MNHDDIDRWDREYKPEQNTQRAGPELLPDGDYDFQIVSAELTVTPKTEEPIFRLTLRVLTPGMYQGQLLERVNFFRTQANVDRLGGDLITLGFDADQWTVKAGRPFSKELQKAAPLLRGRCFKGRKQANPSDDGKKTYHNLYCNTRLPDQPVPDNVDVPALPSGEGDAIPF